MTAAAIAIVAIAVVVIFAVVLSAARDVDTADSGEV